MASNILEQQAPPEPLAALTHTIITPENIALDARINRAEPMGRFALLKARWRCWWLERSLRHSGRPALETEHATLENEIRTLRRYKVGLADERAAQPNTPHLEEMW